MIFLSILSHLLVLIASLIAILFAYYKWSFQYWKKRNIPYLEPSFPFGNLMNMLTRKMSRIEELSNMYNDLKRKGYKHCGIWQMAKPSYFVVDLEILKNICIKDFDYFAESGFYYNEKDEPIGAHLIALGGERWKSLRKKSSTIFTTTKLKRMLPNSLDIGKRMENYMDELIEKNALPVNMKDIATSFSIDAIGSASMGIQCRSFTDPDRKFMYYGRQALETDRLGQVRFLIGVFFRDFARKLGLRQVKKEIGDFFSTVIRETIHKRETQKIERNDFLQLLMGLKNQSGDNLDGPKLTLDNVIALSFGLFIGGFETSASTFTFCTFELARHPEIQEKVRNEIKSVLAKYNNELTYESLGEMTYLRQCMDETWRLYPAVHKMNRVCTRDYKVPGEDLVIEKGTPIIMTITGIHRDPEYFPDPTRFDPDRFSEENKRKIPPYAYIPFGAGPKVCIGERYAIMQVKTALALIFGKYRISLDKKTKLPMTLSPTTLVPVIEGGLWVNVEKV